MTGTALFTSLDDFRTRYAGHWSNYPRWRRKGCPLTSDAKNRGIVPVWYSIPFFFLFWRWVILVAAFVGLVVGIAKFAS